MEQFHANVDAVKSNYGDIAVRVDGNANPQDVTSAIQQGIDSKLGVREKLYKNVFTRRSLFLCLCSACLVNKWTIDKIKWILLEKWNYNLDLEFISSFSFFQLLLFKFIPNVFCVFLKINCKITLYYIILIQLRSSTLVVPLVFF